MHFLSLSLLDTLRMPRKHSTAANSNGTWVWCGCNPILSNLVSACQSLFVLKMTETG